MLSSFKLALLRQLSTAEGRCFLKEIYPNKFITRWKADKSLNVPGSVYPSPFISWLQIIGNKDIKDEDGTPHLFSSDDPTYEDVIQEAKIYSSYIDELAKDVQNGQVAEAVLLIIITSL